MLTIAGMLAIVTAMSIDPSREVDMTPGPAATPASRAFDFFMHENRKLRSRIGSYAELAASRRVTRPDIVSRPGDPSGKRSCGWGRLNSCR
jgi:hypothetical protein